MSELFVGPNGKEAKDSGWNYYISFLIHSTVVGFGMVWHEALVITYAEAFKDQNEAEDNDFLVLPNRILYLKKIYRFSRDTIINVFDITGKLQINFFPSL